MLPWRGSAATMASLRCYHGAAALLQMKAHFATKGYRPCYKDVRRTLLPWQGCFCCKGWQWLMVLPSRGGVATRGGRRCYRRGAVVLQGANDIAASADIELTSPATSRRVSPITAVDGGGDAWRGEKTLLQFSGEVLRRPPRSRLGSPATRTTSSPATVLARGRSGAGGREGLGDSSICGNSQIVECVFPSFFSLFCWR
jgi:hypothetical protein